MKRIALGVLAFAALASCAAIEAYAQYPQRPVRLIVEFPAGGAVDVFARRIGGKLTERLGQQIVVDNRAGAGGVIAHDLVAKSVPDGHTLLLATTALTANPALHRKLPYDPQADFVPIALMADWAGLLVVHPSLPANSLGEFVAYAKANPDRLSYASAGTGSFVHLAMEMFKSRAGIRLVHVPYKGAAPALADVIGGHIAAKIDSYVTAMPHVRNGRLRLLAVTTAQRIAQAPDVPSIAESGYPGYDTAIWLGLLAPRGTPRAIAARLESDVVAAIKTPDITARLIEDGYRPLGGSAADLAALSKREVVQWRQLAREIGIEAAD